MFAQKLRNGLFATAAGGALFLGLGIGPAAADLLPFQIDPNALTTTGGPYSNVTATDINGVSNALIQQTGATTQTETGWLQVGGLTNNGVNVPSTASRLVKEGDIGTPGTDVYGMYLTFKGTVNGISGFGPGQSGTVGAGDYTFTLWGDLQSNDNFSNVGSTSASGGTIPTVGSTTGDVVLAQGSSVQGSVGFAPTSGAPFFDVLADFVVCNGTAGQGLKGGQTVAAAGCGSFDGTSYFVSPTPFYAFDFNSSISGSANNLSVYGGTLDAGAYPNATLNGIVADINFVPEPMTLSLVGFGLLAIGAISRWRRPATWQAA